MENIYSRRRFIIKPFWGNKSKNPKKEKLKKKVIKFIIIISISIYGFKTCLDYIQPVYETLCNEKSKSVATIITNRQTTIYMNKYQYDELFSIEKDNNGNITLIKANVTPINNMISDLTESIQHEFDNVGTQTIEITLGSFMGNSLLAGIGSKIPINVDMTGTVDTEVKSEFISKGINQTLHRIYVVFDCKMSVVTPMKNYTQNIINQFIVAENVIVGNIPDSYYNLEGLEEPLDSLNLMK